MPLRKMPCESINTRSRLVITSGEPNQYSDSCSHRHCSFTKKKIFIFILYKRIVKQIRFVFEFTCLAQQNMTLKNVRLQIERAMSTILRVHSVITFRAFHRHPTTVCHSGRANSLEVVSLVFRQFSSTITQKNHQKKVKRGVCRTILSSIER
jgi:hypothetical protein